MRRTSVIPAKPENATHATVDRFGGMRLYVSEDEAREHSAYLGVDSEIIRVHPVKWSAAVLPHLVGQSFLWPTGPVWFARVDGGES